MVTEIWSDGTDLVAFRAWMMPRPKPKRYYWSHPWPQRSRRILYALWAVLMALSYAGTSSIQGVDRIAPVCFAMACAWCAIGVFRVESWTIWWGSGVAVFCSYLVRLVQIFIIELGWTNQTPPDSSSLASSAYIGLCVGSVAVWRHWLHPRVTSG